MRNKLGFAAALVLLTAALTAPHAEASACTASCLSQEQACIRGCNGVMLCQDNCIDQWNSCMGNVCHVYI